MCAYVGYKHGGERLSMAKLCIFDTPLKPAAINPVAIGGLSQPLVDVAAILSIQDKPAYAKSLAEAAWIIERVAQSPACMEILQARADEE